MNRNDRKSRREFLRKIIASGVMLGMAPYAGRLAAMASAANKGKLPARPLGRTGHMVGIFSLGGQGSIEVPGREDISVEIVERAIDLGINYIDTAAAYGRATAAISREEAMGTSEKNIGRVMKHRRSEVFLASKTHDRTYDGSMRLLERSLKNLQTDHLDLWQVHNVRKAEMERLDEYLGPGGVIKAMEKAKEQGIVRFIGYTGHESPDVLKAFLERYPFDNVLVAINAADKHHDPFIEKFLPTAIEKQIGIVGMKIPARDRIFSHGGIISMKEAMEYVLTLPVSTIVVGMDNIRELGENIRIAREFSPLTEDEMLATEDKTRPHHEHLLFFKGLSDWPADW